MLANSNQYWKIMTKVLTFVKKSGLDCIVHRVLHCQGKRCVFDLVLIIKPSDIKDWQSFIKSQGIKYYSFPVQCGEFPCIQFLHLNEVKIK
jgi:hypothetical protein